MAKLIYCYKLACERKYAEQVLYINWKVQPFKCKRQVASSEFDNREIWDKPQ